MSATPLLFAAGAGPMSRSASSLVARAASAFHVFRIDGYSQTKTILPGECVSSRLFSADGGNKYYGNRNHWQIDVYPNGVDASTKVSDSIAVYLKLAEFFGQGDKPPTFLARYKFSLIDHAGHAAYELPPRTAVFRRGADERGDGYDEFIAREELERRDDLLRDDCVTVRCDVGVTTKELSEIALDDVVDTSDDEDDGSDYSGRRRRRRPRRRLDDNEYVRWCVSEMDHARHTS